MVVYLPLAVNRKTDTCYKEIK